MGNIDPQRLIMSLVAIVLGVTVHEFSHAFVAYRLGDPTAHQLGRVSLNPLVHFDPLGAMMMLFLMLGYAPIAWGKPVPINTMRIKGGRRGLAWSSMAGPASNLMLASFFAIPLHMGLGASMSPELREFISTVIFINIGLAAFNFLPLPPLDGFNTLSGLLPNGWVTPIERLRRPATAGLMVLVILPWAVNQLNLANVNVNVLSAMVGPLYQLFGKLLLPAGGCCYVVHDHAEHSA
jgi:Zn-dependent protease